MFHSGPCVTDSFRLQQYGKYLEEVEASGLEDGCVDCAANRLMLEKAWQTVRVKQLVHRPAAQLAVVLTGLVVFMGADLTADNLHSESPLAHGALQVANEYFDAKGHFSQAAWADTLLMTLKVCQRLGLMRARLLVRLCRVHWPIYVHPPSGFPLLSCPLGPTA